MLSARLNNMDCGLKPRGRTGGAVVSGNGKLLTSTIVCLLAC